MNSTRSHSFSVLDDPFFNEGRSAHDEFTLTFDDFSFEILAALVSAPELATPPGTQLDEWLAQHPEVSREEVATRLNLSLADFDLLVVGARALTPGLAWELELITGVSERLWMDLENHYREQILALGTSMALDREWPLPSALSLRPGDPYP